MPINVQGGSGGSGDLAPLTSAIELNNTKIGDISTLVDSSADLVTEVNLKAKQVDLEANYLKKDQLGTRESLYSFDSTQIAYLLANNLSLEAGTVSGVGNNSGGNGYEATWDGNPATQTQAYDGTFYTQKAVSYTHLTLPTNREV